MDLCRAIELHIAMAYKPRVIGFMTLLIIGSCTMQVEAVLIMISINDEFHVKGVELQELAGEPMKHRPKSTPAQPSFSDFLVAQREFSWVQGNQTDRVKQPTTSSKTR